MLVRRRMRMGRVRRRHRLMVRPRVVLIGMLVLMRMVLRRRRHPLMVLV